MSQIDRLLDRLLETKEPDYSPDLWRMALNDLRTLVLKGQPWLTALTKVARNWKMKNPEIVRFLIRNKLLKSMKSGELKDQDIQQVVAKLSGSQEEFDTYIAKNPLKKRKKDGR